METIMSTKSKLEKREAAEARATSYTWENSKAKRLGTKTKEEWEAARTQ
jgi:hypothetical protein